MASSSEPRILVFKSDGAIPKGYAVKAGSDKNHVAIGAANTDRCMGIAQNATTGAEQAVEVAMPGGGGKAFVGETVVAGNDLVSGTDGKLMLPNTDGDEVIARCVSGGAASDLVGVEIYMGIAGASQ